MAALPPARRRRPRSRRVLRLLFSKDWRGGVLMLVTLTTIVVLATLPLGGSRHSQLSAYDDDWDDISLFRRDLENDRTLNVEVRTVETSATALESIDNASNMLYIAIGVERPYSFTEWRALRNFVSRGGNVWIADDYGEANSLLSYDGGERDNPAFTRIGDEPRGQYVFSGERLADVNFDRNTLLVRATVQLYPDRELDLLLNDPSCFEENDNFHSDEASVVFASSDLSWIDSDQNGERSRGEMNGSYPLMIIQDGWFLLSDPSIFTNDMYYRADNDEFVRFMVVALLPEGGTVIIDESVHIEPGLLDEVDDIILRPAYVLLGEAWPCYSGIIGVVIATAFGIRAMSRRVRRVVPHADRLEEPRVGDFGSPVNWVSDYYEVRGVLLQRLRFAYGLEPEELPRLPPALVAELLGDEVLANFTLRPMAFDHAALNTALEAISSWRPPLEADAVMDKVERYLAAQSGVPPPDPGLSNVRWETPSTPHQGPGGGLT